MAKRKSKSNSKMLRIKHPDAAGIDIGSREHWVAVPEGRDKQPVRSFETFTGDLHRLAAWLEECGIRTVAMESTGVYWIPIYEILEQRGFEVLLVNASHVRNVPGRKSDVLDCQWIQQLHSYGLLRGSFRPPAAFAELRTYMRHRQMLIESAARHLQHMQKALEQMNVQVHHAVSDIAGKTGMAIVRAIVAGNRDPKKLAKHRDPRCRASVERIAAALTGNYKSEHVFELQQALGLYDMYQVHLAECDERIEAALNALAASFPELPATSYGKQPRPVKNQPAFDVRPAIQQIVGGVDLACLPGIGPLTMLNLVAETGVDMTKWRTEKHFTSWLNFAPGTNITGGKARRAKRRRTKNRAGQVLRQAAVSVGRTTTALGAFYRRLAARRGKRVAVVATARKLACIYYRLLRYGGEYVEKGAINAENNYRRRTFIALQRQARRLGFELQPVPSET